MTSFSRFFILSLFLLLLSPISPLTFTNYEILDLEATSLATEASAWTVTNQLSASPVYTCSGSQILGGYGVVGVGGAFSRLYTSLPEHDVIYFSISFWIIDLESAQDLFKIYFDTQLVNTYDSPNFDYSYAGYTSICGGSLKDYPSLIVTGKVPHTSNQLTLKITSLLGSSDTFSFGFRDISLLLQNTTTTPSLASCTFTGGYSDYSCLCPAKSYKPPSSFSCKSCNSACQTCVGGTSSDCTSCPSGYSFNGQTCVQCDSSCSICTGSAANQCVTCSSNNYLYWNGSCLASCDDPFVKGNDAVNNQNTCELPCGTSGFLYQNGSCNANCDFPFVQGSSGDIKTCNFKCSAPQFLYPNKTCQETCDSPLIKEISAYERYCYSPCPTSEFIYANGSCSVDCESPFVERFEGGLKYCDKPCPEDSYLYWNGSCIDYCPLAFQDINSTVNYCNFYCPIDEYLYWNQTCITSCEEPLVESTDSESYKYCNKPCPNDEFYYQNQSCYSSCPEPYESSTFEEVSLCNSPCSLGQFYYEKSSSCLDSCDSPMVSEKIGLLKICYDGDDDDETTTPPDNNNSTTTTPETPDNFTLSGSIGKLTSTVSAVSGFFRPSSGSSVFMVALAKMLRYVIYLDIELPDTLLESFQSKNSGAFSISTTYSYPMPNSLKNLYTNGTLPELLTGKDSGTSYLINQWESLSTFSLVFAMGIGFSLFERLLKNSKHKVLICVIRRLRIITKWNLLLFLFFNGFDNVALYAIMEIYTLRLDSFASILSFVVCILTTVLALYILMQTFRMSWETQRRRVQIAPEGKQQTSFYTKWNTFQGLYAGIKDCSLLQHAYLFISACRIIACYLIVGFLYAYPVIQTALFSIFSVLMVYYLLKLRPIKDFINFLIAISYELLILTVNFCILLVAILDAYENYSKSIRNPIYYIILFGNTAVQMLGNACVFIYIICGLISAYKISKAPGLMPKTSYISAFVSIYQNPGMDFADESHDDPDTTIKIIISAASLNAQQKIREKPQRLSRIRPLITKKSSLALTDDTEALSKSRTLTENGSCGLKDGDTISNLIHIWPSGGQSKLQPKRSSLFKTRRGSGISEITVDSEVEISISGGQSQAFDNLLAESTPKCENLSVKNTERQGSFSPNNAFSPSQNRQQRILSMRRVGSMAPIFKRAPVVESVIMEEASPYMKHENETEISQRSRANSRESNTTPVKEGSQKNLDGLMMKSQFFAKKVSEDPLGMFDIEKTPLRKPKEKGMLKFDFAEEEDVAFEKNEKKNLKPPTAQTTRQRARTGPMIATRSTLSNDVRVEEQQDLLSTTLEMELKKSPEKNLMRKKLNEISTRTSTTQNVLPTVRGSLVVEDVRNSENSFAEKRREFVRQSTTNVKTLIGRLMAPYHVPLTISSFSGEQQQDTEEERKSSKNIE